MGVRRSEEESAQRVRCGICAEESVGRSGEEVREGMSSSWLWRGRRAGRPWRMVRH